MARGSAPPESVVSACTGLVGLAALVAVLVYMTGTDLPIAHKTFLALAAPAAAMAIWELFVNKTHLRPTTGLDFSRPAPLAENIRRTAVKLFGLWGTWVPIAVAYGSIRTYAADAHGLYLSYLTALLPVLLWLSAIYVLVIDRYSTRPEDDGAWHAGRLFAGQWRKVDRGILIDYFLGWAIKAFFLAFMISILPASIEYFDQRSLASVLGDPVAFASWCVNGLFLIDICFGALGYVMCLRFLDTHIRTANPYLSAWTVVLICYPPFVLMGDRGPLDYRDGQEWFFWMAGNEVLLWVWGGALVLLTAIYAWSTVIFGLRFSNLTHRGIITNGPYRLSKHPAYISKNVFWWLVHVPFFSTAGIEDALRNSVLLVLVNVIYYLRAKTEEKHLLGDPLYRSYALWIAENGLFARAKSMVFGK